MDWIEPRQAVKMDKKEKARLENGNNVKSNRQGANRAYRKGKGLSARLSAALAQPLDVWSAAFDHALGKLKWPQGCSDETTLLFSAIMQEQAEVLVRCGVSAKKLAAILDEGSDDQPADQRSVSEPPNIVGLMDQSLESLAFQWLDNADTYAHAALATIALVWHLPDHAKRAGNDWLAQWLQSTSDRMATYKPDLEEPVLCHLVFQCELPLLMAVGTAASKRTVVAEASAAMDYLAEYLERGAENAAPWLVYGATYLRASLACVLRCRVLADALGLRKWYPPQQKALASLLSHAARWSRPDGTQLLAAGNCAPKSKSIWSALASQAKSNKAMHLAMALAGIGSVPRGEAKGKSKSAKLPALTHYSRDSAGVCMRSDWRNRGGQVAIDFSDSEMCLEAIGSKGEGVLAGEWKTHVELNGQAQLQLDEWEEICWFSDKDVDYLEVETRVGQHCRIQRQIMLLRDDHLLLLADSLLAEESGDWTFKSQIPLANNTQFLPAKKSHEGFLLQPNGLRFLTLPLFQPEWRTQPGEGKFASEASVLTAGISSKDRMRFYVPTLISLRSSHALQPFTWRRLTVGEDLQIVSPDEAVAYRVQIGKDQWIIYRTLTPVKRRTALGMHTMADFFVGRFSKKDGSIETMVEVEA
ncbi:MAG: hypothetical protein KDB22_17735 [Planctomycetales bacterium]|nr:hypothetical protein [Planctomycetales bacterium]